eukprot:scaffold48873_cov309-Isochrysis_galbana.AAC.3
MEAYSIPCTTGAEKRSDEAKEASACNGLPSPERTARGWGRQHGARALRGCVYAVDAPVTLANASTSSAVNMRFSLNCSRTEWLP